VTGGQGQTVDGIPCGTPNTTFQVNSHLTIVLNNVLLEVPGPLGILPPNGAFAGCSYQINTHDGSGRIHIEAPAPVSYNLGNFFHVWGQPLAADNVAGITTQPIVIFITESDGTTTVYQGDPNAIALTAHRLITIQIGDPPLTEIPNYTWSPN
jgi:hypothetical protein